METEIRNQILEYLSYRKDVFVFIHDTVGIYDQARGCYRRRNSRFHIRGVSDIIGMIKTKAGSCRFLAIEVKSPSGRLSPFQKEFLERVSAMGGLAFVARSVLDVVNQLQVFDRGTYDSLPETGS